MEILPLPQTEFTISPWLEERISDGKFGDRSEAVFQTYELPFELFLEEEPALDPDKLTEITFYLQGKMTRLCWMTSASMSGMTSWGCSKEHTQMIKLLFRVTCATRVYNEPKRRTSQTASGQRDVLLA